MNSQRGGLIGFGGRTPIQAAFHARTFNLLLQSGDAHFKKLIEVGISDAEKFEPFEQRVGGIQGFLHHTVVKFQPAELSIDEMGRDATHENGDRSLPDFIARKQSY